MNSQVQSNKYVYVYVYVSVYVYVYVHIHICVCLSTPRSINQCLLHRTGPPSYKLVAKPLQPPLTSSLYLPQTIEFSHKNKPTERELDWGLHPVAINQSLLRICIYIYRYIRDSLKFRSPLCAALPSRLVSWPWDGQELQELSNWGDVAVELAVYDIPSKLIGYPFLLPDISPFLLVKIRKRESTWCQWTSHWHWSGLICCYLGQYERNHLFNGNSRILKWRYCTIFLAIFCSFIMLYSLTKAKNIW